MTVHVQLPTGKACVPNPQTKEEVARYLALVREDAKAARAKLPEWRRYFDDLVEFIPDEHVKEARGVLVPLLNAMGRAAILDARKFSAECFTAMDQETTK